MYEPFKHLKEFVALHIFLIFRIFHLHWYKTTFTRTSESHCTDSLPGEKHLFDIRMPNPGVFNMFQAKDPLAERETEQEPPTLYNIELHKLGLQCRAGRPKVPRTNIPFYGAYKTKLLK